MGTYAVQVAKALGAIVTGVCRTHNVEMVRSLGADHVVDYTEEAFTRSGRRYDLFFDIAGSRKLVGYAEGARHRWNGHRGRWPQGRPPRPAEPHHLGEEGATLTREKTKFFIAKFNRLDMEYLAELMDTGKMRSVVDKQFQGLEEPRPPFATWGRGMLGPRWSSASEAEFERTSRERRLIAFGASEWEAKNG